MPAEDIADSTWRSIALQKQIITNNNETEDADDILNKQSDARLTIDDLGLTKSSWIRQDNIFERFDHRVADNTSYQATIPADPINIHLMGTNSAHGGHFSSNDAS